MADEISRERMAEQARLATAVLSQGRGLDHWSLLFTGFALAAPLVTAGSAAGRLGLLAVVLAGLAQKYFAVRVGLDREIFRSWAERWQRQGADPFADLEEMDRSLAALNLARNAEATIPRPLPDRVQGALRLFRRQVLAFAIQVLLLVLGAGLL